MARRLGIGGFLLFCLWSLGTFGLLGAAWLAAAPGERAARVGLFAWARMVREAVSDLLPFAQLGGIVVGTRTLIVAGVPQARVYGSFVVDMTTEMAAQLVYTLFGLALMASLLIGDGAGASLRPTILGGTGVMVAAILFFFLAQRSALDLTERIAGYLLPGSAAAVGDIRAELVCIYAKRWHVGLAFALNLAGWVASGVGAWIALRLMEVHISLWDVLSLESLIFTLRSHRLRHPRRARRAGGGLCAGRPVVRPAAGIGAGIIARQARPRPRDRPADPARLAARRGARRLSCLADGQSQPAQIATIAISASAATMVSEANRPMPAIVAAPIATPPTKDIQDQALDAACAALALPFTSRASDCRARTGRR